MQAPTQSNMHRLAYAAVCLSIALYAKAPWSSLDRLADQSVDLIAAFEILEHLAEPERFLARGAARVAPGRRIVLSVPNQWLDAEGKDPNPHHLQVYDWRSLAQPSREAFPDGGCLYARWRAAACASRKRRAA